MQPLILSSIKETIDGSILCIITEITFRLVFFGGRGATKGKLPQMSQNCNQSLGKTLKITAAVSLSRNCYFE